MVIFFKFLDKFSSFQILMLSFTILQSDIVIACPFRFLEESILSEQFPLQEQMMHIPFFDLQSFDSVGFGFWSQSQPLFEPKGYPFVDQDFQESLGTNGQLIMTIYGETYMMLHFAYYDIQQQLVFHILLLFDSFSYKEMYFAFPALEYEGQWLFTFITLQYTQEKKIKVIFEMSNQNIWTNFLDIKENSYSKIFLGGRGYIMSWLNLNYYRGYITLLYQKQGYFWNEKQFQEVSNFCSLPRLPEVSVLIPFERSINYDGSFITTYPIGQFGRNYCISGWFKMDLSQIIVSFYQIIIRITAFQFYSNKYIDGDELFQLGVNLDIENPNNTQLQIMANMHKIPLSGYLGQYSTLNLEIIQYLNSNIVYQGLQQWFFIQYEYGRKSNNKYGLFSAQFFNEIGLFQKQIGNQVYGGSFRNIQYYILIGGDDHFRNYMIAQTYNIKFEYNYDQDKQNLDFGCHYSCNTCSGPLQNNCLTCSENKNRFYQKDSNTCNCKHDMIEQGKSCVYFKSYYLEVKKSQQEFNQLYCPLGYFQIKKQNGNFICFPEQNEDSIFCAECYFNPQTWYLNPQCLSDIIPIRDIKDYALNQQYRDNNQIDQYLIDEFDNLLLKPGLLKICDFNQCQATYLTHLGNKISIECKTNFIYEDGNCIFSQPNCEVVFENQCITCIQGMFLNNNICVPCNNHCLICNNLSSANCIKCEKGYFLIDNQCKKCGKYCKFCGQEYDINLQKPYLKCYSCEDKSKYFLSFDGINCVENSIKNCEYAFQSLKSNIQQNTLNNYFTKQTDFSLIEIHCARCKTNYIYLFEDKLCMRSTTLQCYFGYAQKIIDYDPNSLFHVKDDIYSYSTTQQVCLINWEIGQDVQQINQVCLYYIPYCFICVYRDSRGNLDCITCYNGYYSEKLSGKCRPCPKALNCLQCYEEEIKFQDDWKQNTRAFHQYVINIHDTHKFILFAQSQNPIDYKVKCRNCKDGYDLYQNTCIESCPLNCAECQIIDSKNVCVRCFQIEKGVQLTLINNQCVSCPENCALCRIRQSEEIKVINPLFNTTDDDLKKYSYQCLKSLKDQNYFYDSSLNNFILCQDTTRGCQNKYEINLNLYCDKEKFIKDLNNIPLEYQKQFLQQNIVISQLQNFNTFSEYDTYNFYKMANIDTVKAIIITITSQKEQICQLFKESYFNQLFSHQIFLATDVSLIINCTKKTTFQIYQSLKFLDFSSVTLNGLIIESIPNSLNKEISFYSVFSLQLLITNCQLKQSSKQSVQIKININQAKYILIQNFIIEESNYNDAIFEIANTNFPKIIKLIEFQFINSNFTNSSIFQINIGSEDKVIIANVLISSIFTNTKFIDFKSPLSQGSISIENVKFQNSKIAFSLNFFNLQIFSHASIKILQILNSKIIDSQLLLFGNSIYLNQFIISNCQLTQENLIIYNNLDGVIQQDQYFMLQDIKISENIYSIQTKFVLLRKYDNYQSQLNLTNLEISNNQIQEITVTYNPQSINNSMINIQIDLITIYNAIINRGFGINDISIFNAKKLIIFKFIIQQDENNRFLTLHSSLDCLYKNIPGDLFTTSIILFSVETLLFQDIYISNIVSKNYPTIYYKSEDKVKLISQENFLIENIKMNSNVLIVTKLQKKVSLILIESSQDINIEVREISINSNILQEYVQDSSFESALTLNFNVPTGQVKISNSNFQQNQIFNTTSSLMLIKSNKIIIQNSIFDNNNIFSYQIIRKHLFWPFDESIRVFIEDIQQQFPIKSISGNGIFDVEILQFINSSICNSTGQIGAGFHIIANKLSQILFQDIVVESIQTYFESNEEYGGAFYLDGSMAQQLNVQIYNIKATKILSRNKGGLMFFKIGVISSKIFINKIIASNVQSLFGSLIYIEFQKNTNQEQLVILKNIDFVSDYIKWKAFLNLFYNIIITEKQYLFYQRTVIQVQSAAQIQIENSKFYNLIYEAAIAIYDIDNVLLADIQFIDCQLVNKMIYIVSNQYVKSNIVVQEIVAKNIKFEIVQNKTGNENCLQINKFKTFTSQWICKILKNQPPTHLDFQKQLVEHLIANCLINQMIDGIDMSISGLLIFESQSQNTNFKLKNINLFDIKCQQCQNGLIWIKTASIDFQLQTVTGLKIKNSVCGLKGCLVIQNYVEQQRILISSEQFIANQSKVLLIENYICQSNFATNGTCIYIESTKIILKNNIFINNIASKVGGAVYIKDIQNILITQSIIENNTAANGGGIYLEDQQQLLYQKLSTLIYNNQAIEFSDNIATIPSKLKVYLDKFDSLPKQIDVIQTSELLIETITMAHTTNYYGFHSNTILLPNGQKISDYQIFDWKSQSYKPLQLQLRIKAYDENNIQIKNLIGSYCEIQHKTINISNDIQDFNFTGGFLISFNETTQDYNLDDQIFYFDSDQPQNLQLQIQFHCNQLKVPIYNKIFPYEIISTHNNYFVRLNVRSFPCQLGEIKNTTLNSCQICDSELGLFSLKLNQTRCSIKDEISTLSVTPVQLQLRQGYWRPFFYSTAVSDCYNFQQNCQGDWASGDSSCYLGHIGALCEQCDIYNTRGDGYYAINKKFSCGSCVDKWKNITLIVFISIWTLLSITISVQGTINNLEQKAKQSGIRLTNMNIISRSICSAVLIKMLTNYFQIISSITTFRIDISSLFISITQAAGSPIKSLIYSLDCFLMDIFNFEIIYTKMIWQLIMPIIYLNVFFIFFVISLQLKSQKFNKSSITTSIIYLYIYFQPTLVGELIGLISYRDISNILWVQSNVSFLYLTNTHISWMVKFCIPLIVLLAILIPIHLFFGLAKNQKQFSVKSVKLIWGYLYIEYKKDAYFWEILKIVQKELIIIALTFYDDYVVLKAIILILILLIYLHFFKWYEPYKNIKLNKLDYISTYIFLITFCLAIGAYISFQQNIKYISRIFILLILIFNIYLFLKFIIDILNQITHETNEKFIIQLDKIRLYLKVRLPFVSKFQCLKTLFQSQQERNKRVYNNFKKLKQFLIPKAREIIRLKNLMKNHNSRSSFSTLAHIRSFEELLKNEQNSKVQKNESSPNDNQKEFQPLKQFKKFPYGFEIKEIKEDSLQNI